MTDYNDGKWHGWNGGECPVHPKSVVQIQTVVGVLNGANQSDLAAGGRCWERNIGDASIVAFRVIKEHREPREYPIDPRVSTVWFSHEDGLIHVREVL